MLVLMMRFCISMCPRQEGWTCLEARMSSECGCGPICLTMYETNSVVNLCIVNILDNIHCL